MKLLRRRHPHPEIPLVSTADVSFLLLIFFLSTAIFATERGIVLGLPAAGATEPIVPLTRMLRIDVVPDRPPLLDGQAVSLDRLRAALAARLRKDPDLLVALSIDGRAPYAALIGTLDQVKLAGARRISIRAGAPRS